MKKQVKIDVSVVIPAYNASRTIGECLRAVILQVGQFGYEVIVVDDGSKDDTGEIIKNFKNVNYIFKENSGPAAARNVGWKKAKGSVVIFTDSDCVPEKDWLEEMIKPFDERGGIGAVGGAYGKTINSDSWLARLIGEEIRFRYSKIGRYTDAHGSYSLAVRKDVLEEVGGFNEVYPVATAEDWDLCYKIVEKGYKIVFNKNARVGHYHPERLVKYLKTQFRHGYYRMMLYQDHKNMIKGDSYSGFAKWIVGLSGLSVLLFLLTWVFSWARLFLILSILGIIGLQLELVSYFIKKHSLKLVFAVLIIQIVRGYYWFFGLIFGLLKIVRHKI